jgi:hypothetical protein
LINLNIGVWLPGLTQDIWGTLLSLISFIVFIFFYQRIMVTQILFKLEKSAEMMENMTEKAKKKVLKKISKRPDSKIKRSVNSFLEFFVISPVSLDPYGIVKKIEHLTDLEKDRFKYFVNQIAPKLDSEQKANLMMGLSGAMSLYMITKIVRHYVELIKKTKSANLAMILQMQLPLIERLAKALLHGTEALSNGWPIGDGIGAYNVASLMDNYEVSKVDDETIISYKKYKNRDVVLIKAKGPGGRTGNPGKVIEEMAKKEKIAKIITIDAALKLEGEKTGTIAEGVGVAIGGTGVEKAYIENVAVKQNLPLDSILIKMNEEEAITQMRKAILESVPPVSEALDAAITRTNEKGKIIIVGVGNTSGVGNNKKDAEKTKEVIKQNIKIMKALAKKRKKRFKLPF